MCLAICTTCTCHLVIFISEESLWTLLSVVQTEVLHLHIIWYCDETTITLLVFLKVPAVCESSECKAKPRRTSLFIIGRFCVWFTQICPGRIWVTLLSRATIRPLFIVDSTCPLFSWEMKWSPRTLKNVKISSFLHFLFYIAVISGVTKGLSQVANLDKRDPLTTVRGPRADTQTKLDKWWRIWVWMAKLNPKSPENNPKNTQTQLTENQKNAKTQI